MNPTAITMSPMCRLPARPHPNPAAPVDVGTTVPQCRVGFRKRLSKESGAPGVKAHTQQRILKKAGRPAHGAKTLGRLPGRRWASADTHRSPEGSSVRVSRSQRLHNWQTRRQADVPPVAQALGCGGAGVQGASQRQAAPHRPKFPMQKRKGKHRNAHRHNTRGRRRILRPEEKKNKAEIVQVKRKKTSEL